MLEGRISYRSKLLAIFKVRKGYVIGGPSLRIVIHPKCHADAFLRLQSTFSHGFRINIYLGQTAEAQLRFRRDRQGRVAGSQATEQEVPQARSTSSAHLARSGSLRRKKST